MAMNPMLKRIRRFATYLLIRLLVVVAGVLPRRVGHALFGWLGGLAYRVLRQSRKVALANLQLVYGGRHTDKQLRDIARRSFMNLGRFAFDAITMCKYPLRGLDAMVEITGRHHLDRALARGEGAIALSGHIGNWELMGAYLARKGYPVNVLATRLRDQRLDDLLVGLRRQAGLKVLERSRNTLGAFRCLKKGEMLGVLIDQDTSVESVTVDFLGHPAKTPVGPAMLASRTGAPVVPMAMLMTPEGKYRIEIREPISSNGDEASLKGDVAAYSKILEEFIRLDPAQWVWMHKRWKSSFSEMYS
jgi:KDO2-lipid IV(A) lauroyltransferase